MQIYMSQKKEINKEHLMTTFIRINDRPVVPYVRQTQRSRFTPRAIRYNKSQAGFRELLELAMNVFNIEAYDKKSKLFLKVEYAMKPDGQKNLTSRIDVDNIYKAVSDAMNDVMYHDDRQILQAEARKEKSEFNTLNILLHNLFDDGDWEKIPHKILENSLKL